MNYSIFEQAQEEERNGRNPHAASPSRLMADIHEDDLMSILSARKYPDPVAQDDQITKPDDGNLLQSLSFGFGVDADGPLGMYMAGAEGLDYLLNGFEQQPIAITKRHSTAPPNKKTKTSKRPASDDEDGARDPKERRKKQIREAQRAYRLRKESRVSSLTKRVSQLEQVIDDMSTTIATFSDSLLQSGVLAPHASLTQCTRETLEKCLHLAKTTNVDEGEESSDGGFEDRQSKNKDPGPNMAMVREQQQNAKDYVPALPTRASTPAIAADPETAPYVQYSTFMDQLHLAILHRGYLTLTDPSISVEGVRQRFRLLYPAMNRGHLASYFAAALHAKISKIELDKQWRSVPFFQLGGAGTHYAWPAELGPYTRRSRHWQAISVPLSHFSSDIQQDLNGDWFDMQDLECFLMEKKIKLVSSPTTVSTHEQQQTLINARQLIKALLLNVLCLGRSAGFRRSDVETALNKSLLV